MTSKKKYTRPPTPPETDTVLRRTERFYKRKDVPLDLSKAFDYKRTTNDGIQYKELGDGIYTFDDHPGLIYLPNHLKEEEQKDLIRLSVKDAPQVPNKTSLDAHYSLPSDGLFHHFANQTQSDVAIPIAYQLDSEKLKNQPDYYQSKTRTLINNEPSDFETLKNISKTTTPEITPSTTVKPLNGEKAMRKLRWTNIGHYYHWGLKQYDFSVRDPETNGPIKVPSLISNISRNVVNLIPWEKSVMANEGQDWRLNYNPDAGIINYYNLNDTLMAHVDRSEVSASLPLVSISLGHSAVFLIGDDVRESSKPPTPILLRSGDVIVMSGPTRRSYHGIPRILENTLPQYLKFDNGDAEWAPYSRYLSQVRININVRQTGLSDKQIKELVSV